MLFKHTSVNTSFVIEFFSLKLNPKFKKIINPR